MSNGFGAKSRLYGQMTDFARHLLLVRPDDDCISCSRRILGVVTGALGVIWGLDAPYEAIVYPMSDGFGAKSRLYGQMTDFACHLLDRDTPKRLQTQRLVASGPIWLIFCGSEMDWGRCQLP